jgi:hypothetical protein
MTARIYPSENAIAVAIVTACRVANEAPGKLFEEHPEGVLAGGYGSRARHYAFAALVDLFPDCPSHRISVWCGFKSNNYGTLSNHRGQTRKLKWWSDEALERVRVVVAAFMGAASPPNLPAKIAAENPPLRKSPEIGSPTSQKAPEIMPEIMREPPPSAPPSPKIVAAPVAQPIQSTLRPLQSTPAPRFIPPPIAPETMDRIARAQEPGTPTGAALEIVTTRVAAHDHAPRMADRDPLPAPRKVMRRVSVTGSLMGDPGHANPREQHGESSKNGGFE